MLKDQPGFDKLPREGEPPGEPLWLCTLKGYHGVKPELPLESG